MIAFIQSSAIPANAVTLDTLAHYNFAVVTISYFLAVAGSFVAISLLKVTRASEGLFKKMGVFLGAVVMATAIWTMHYTGMMAHSMQMEHRYDLMGTALSGGIAFAFSLVAFIILTGRNFQLWHSIAAAPPLGMGVATMHYVGMAAMDMHGDMYYRLLPFVLSIAIAVIASAAALLIMHRVIYLRRYQLIMQVIAALVMGVAVCGMHYTGMLATVIIPNANNHSHTMHEDVLPFVFNVALIAALVIAVAASFMLLAANKGKHLSFQIAAVFLATCLALGLTLMLLESTLVRKQVEEQSSQQQILAGKLVMNYIENRLNVAETLAINGANAVQHAPKDAALLKKLLPEIINNSASRSYVAGGGYWPEPNFFTPGVERSSFFWGREKNGKLKYFDDYNKTEGNGYHHEEWYVPARFKKDNTCYWSKSYVDPYSFQPMVTCTIPIFDGETFTGVSTIDLKLEGLNSILDQSAKTFGGYGFILDRNNKLITFPDDTLVRAGGKNPESAEANEYIGSDELVRRMPLFQGIATKLQILNETMVNAAKAKDSGQITHLTKTLHEESYQINPDEAILIASLLSAPPSANEVPQQDASYMFTLDDDPMLRTPVYVNIFVMPETHWKLVLVVPISTTLAKADAIGKKMMALTIVAAVLLLAIFYLYLNKVLLRPVHAMIQTLSNSHRRLIQHTFNPSEAAPTLLLDESINNEIGTIAYWYNRRTSELMEAKLKADQANATKSDFLSNMSHELRTPLNSMIGMAELLADRQHDPETDEMLKIIQDAGLNLLEIVNDILDLSKIESGGLELESVPFYLKELLDTTINQLKPLASSKNLLLINQLTIDPQAVMVGDPTRTKRIMVNLIGNAIKYTEKGSVTVTGSLERTAVDHWQLTANIADTGIGIAENKIDRIFEKFNQADNTITRKYGGSGLGLSITRELLQIMGGTIRVTSKLGVGSTFTVMLPYYIGTHNDIATFERPDLTQRVCGTLDPTKIKLLVAEDHLLNQALMRKLLPAKGFSNFTIVEDGRALIDAYMSGGYDLILTDCHMPNVSGYEATIAIREHEKETGDRIPIVAMTANAMIGEEERCLEIGMDGYISKPIDRARLHAVLERWVRFPATEPAVTQAGDSAAILDLSVLTPYTNGDIAEEREFAELFFAQSKAQLAELSEQCTSGENSIWVELAHKLKGGAATIGAFVLRDVCSEAQSLLQATAADREAMLTRIRTHFDDVCKRLKELSLIA